MTKLLNNFNQDLNSAMTHKAAAITGVDIDEDVYPPESAIKPAVIQRVKKAHADIAAGKGKMYDSIDDFFREIES